MVERSKILEVYIAPISGGGFPGQLAQILYNIQQKQKAFSEETENISSYYTPDLCMGTSGGNVALYISISGNFTEGGIKRVISSMNPEMFSQTWWPGPLSFIPTWVLGIFEGAIYKPGYGAENLLKAYNNDQSITKVEMWNTAFNKEQKRTGLFCNKNVNDTFISPLTYSTFDFKTLPLKFLNGNIPEIARTVIGSASIPLLFKPVEIEGEEYEDGGITFPSPLTPLQNELYNCVKGIVSPSPYSVIESSYPIPEGTTQQIENLTQKRNKEILHMIYFSPYNMDNTNDSAASVLGNGSFLSSMTDASAIKDRFTGINLLQRLKSDSQIVDVIDSRTYNEGVEGLYNLFKEYNNTHYFCEIYLRENGWIDLNKFNAGDIFNKINEANKNIEFLFFYVKN